MRAAEQLFFEGNRHLAAGRPARAAACFRRAVALAPGLGEAHANLAWVLDEADARDEADAAYRRALALNPSHVQIHLNYGAFLARVKRLAEAEAIYRRALEFDPASAPAWSNLGVLYMQMARFEQAEDCCRRSMALDPGYAKARINLGYLCLRQGRFEEGWQHHEWRTWQCTLAQRVDGPRWTGQALAGKSVLVGAEGGHGDVIQFCRYAGVLKRLGARRVALLCHPALKDLLESQPAIDEVLPLDAPLARSGWDFWISLMSLPLHCGTRLHSIPADLPYLQAGRDDAARWSRALPRSGVRIGLISQGNPAFENDEDRSIASLDVLEPLGRVAGVTFIDLQKDRAAGETPLAGSALKRWRPDAPIETFADTAALIENLDLVISVDTAAAHLAGALGKPCWVLLPHHLADWRWLVERSDSPWYPGVMRLFRQPARGDWGTVVSQVGGALEQFVRERQMTQGAG